MKNDDETVPAPPAEGSAYQPEHLAARYPALRRPVAAPVRRWCDGPHEKPATRTYVTTDRRGRLYSGRCCSSCWSTVEHDLVLWSAAIDPFYPAAAPEPPTEIQVSLW